MSTPDRLEIRLGQLVNVVGRRMSKRSGNFIKLDSVIEEFGPDATRLLSLLNSIDQATTLDLDLMKRQSMENPVFYVQYAHARIASIDRRRIERGIERVPIAEAQLSLLEHDRELELSGCSSTSPAPWPRPPGTACPAQGHELGPRARGRVPRLLSRLPCPLRGDPARAHPGAALARRRGEDRPCHRARAARGPRARRDVTAPAPEGPIDWALLPDTSAITGDGHLSVGGIDLLELAEQFGTPVFVYDEEHLRNRCREAVAGFGPGVAYATKAFLCKAMAALAIEEEMSLDVSTGGELAVALAGGASGHQLVCHGNNKSLEELTAALAAGVGRIVVDSFDEIDRLAALWCRGPGAQTRPHPVAR